MSVYKNIYTKNLQLSENNIISNDTDSDINITPNGGGDVMLNANTVIVGRLRIHHITEPLHAGDGEGLLYKKIGDGGIFWKPDSDGVEIDLTTGPVYKRTAITSTESPYTIAATDEFIGVDTTTAVVTVTLPLIAGLIGVDNYKKFHIVDEGGNSTTNNITVSTTSGDTINKTVSPMIINSDHTSVNLYNDGVSNWVIY
jgi:hypothetical protein